MTGFDSKRQASLDTLDQLPYQGRESRPDELAQPNPWRDAIDAELICTHIGTAESFPTAQAALDALINWHIATALDPAVSSAAQALIDKGATQPQAEPVAWISEYGVQELTFDNAALGSLEWEVKRNHERGYDVPLYAAPQAAVAEPLTEGWPGLERFARAVEQAHGIKGRGCQNHSVKHLALHLPAAALSQE